MTKPKTVKPKREWERWALIDKGGYLVSVEQLKSDLYYGFTGDFCKRQGLKIKKVLVIEK